MKKTNISLVLLVLVLLVSCKTQEDIDREQMVDGLSVQMVENQKLSADATARLQGLEERISGLNGQIEETDHNNKTTFSERFKNLEERLLLMEESSKLQSSQLQTVTQKLEAQSKYIKDVIGGLKSLTNNKKSKKRRKSSLYNEAMENYKRARYKKAKKQFRQLLASKKLKYKQKTRTIHNLAMILYMNKKYSEAASLFSRLFTEHNKSSYNKNGLLYLAKSFKGLKKNEEAKQTLHELVSRFPKAKQVKEAKKMLAKL